MSAYDPKRKLTLLKLISCISHEAIFGCSVKWLALSTNCFAFAGILRALSYKARFGRSMKWLAFSTNRLAFAGLRHRAADK